MDAIDSVVDPLREFAKDSVRLVKRCHKPDQKDFDLKLKKTYFKLLKLEKIYINNKFYLKNISQAYFSII
ncbi:transport protein SEC [Salix suchowensis]|nr:transport protein SEC [Salix suchowensis]